MNRIRYVKKENKLVSLKEVVSQRTGAKYRVYIDLDSMTYMLRNSQTLRKYEGGTNINNLNVLKRTVKKHLEQLGCKFGKENRNRTFGLVPKGYSQEIHKKSLEQEQNVNQQ